MQWQIIIISQKVLRKVLSVGIIYAIVYELESRMCFVVYKMETMDCFRNPWLQERLVSTSTVNIFLMIYGVN